MSEFLGRYELLRRIAAGGMGEVHLARQRGPEGFQKFLVIKTLRPHLTEDQDFVNMFFDEARIAAMLSHPNIAQIFDLGEAGGRSYIAMEYVHGQTLVAVSAASAKAPAHAALSLGLKCRIISGAAQALDCAHDCRDPAGRPLGLVHRDVSPQNVMISYLGIVKLVDFGIAKANNKLARTATGIIKGKHAYMSPEQAWGEPLDRRSDVFALGIVFHELLTGKRLFLRDNEMETLRAVADAQILPPSATTPLVPKALDAIVMKALERDQAKRYATCGQLQADLDALITRQRLPASVAHLAAVMQGLFPAESAPGALQQVATAAADEEPTPPSESTATALHAPGAGPWTPEPELLEQRLRSCAAGAQVYGLFLLAVEAAVTRALGSAAAATVHAAAAEPRAWVASLRYPTRELLRVLWSGLQQLAQAAGDIDAAFAAIGEAAFAALIASPLGAPLVHLPRGAPPETRVVPLIQLLQPMVQPGTRTVTEAAPGAAQVVLKGEVLPPQLYLALLQAAFRHFGAPPPVGRWEQSMPDRIELHLHWDPSGDD